MFGATMTASIAIIAITTRISIRVKPDCAEFLSPWLAI
jgi:hypothetical protein